MENVTIYRMSDVGGEAKDQLEMQGLILPDSPSEGVDLPEDVSEMDNKDLMILFARFTAWCDYASAQVGLAVISEREAERELDRREANAWRALDVPRATVAMAKALITLDIDVQKARMDLDEHHAYRRLVTDLAARYERDAAVLSRELTRRTSEHSPKTARRERWSNQ